MSNETPLCLVRGSINVDEFFHVNSIARPGETLSSTRFERRAGGKGANQAVAIARAGAHVKLVGAIGSDGDWLLEDLTSFGVDASKVVTTNEEPTGRAIIQLTPEGENSIILHKGANFLNTVSLSQPGEVRYTHLLLQNEIPFDTTLAYLSHSHHNRKISFLNPSPLPTKDQMRAFPWEQLDWLIVNEGEALGLLTILSAESRVAVETDGIAVTLGDDNRVDRVPIAKRLLQDLHTHTSFSEKVNIVCTLGSLGVLTLAHLSEHTFDSDVETLYVPAADIRPQLVLDTTGAGDCFTGYLVAGLMELSTGLEGTTGQCVLPRDGVKRVLERCVEASGLCVQMLGAMESIPSRVQVENALSGRNLNV